MTLRFSPEAQAGIPGSLDGKRLSAAKISLSAHLTAPSALTRDTDEERLDANRAKDPETRAGWSASLEDRNP